MTRRVHYRAAGHVPQCQAFRNLDHHSQMEIMLNATGNLTTNVERVTCRDCVEWLMSTLIAKATSNA